MKKNCTTTSSWYRKTIGGSAAFAYTLAFTIITKSTEFAMSHGCYPWQWFWQKHVGYPEPLVHKVHVNAARELETRLVILSNSTQEHVLPCSRNVSYQVTGPIICTRTTSGTWCTAIKTAWPNKACDTQFQGKKKHFHCVWTHRRVCVLVTVYPI